MYEYSRTCMKGSRPIILSPLQMETVTKILIKMCPLSTDGAILMLVFNYVAQICNILKGINGLLLYDKHVMTVSPDC